MMRSYPCFERGHKTFLPFPVRALRKILAIALVVLDDRKNATKGNGDVVDALQLDAVCRAV